MIVEQFNPATEGIKSWECQRSKYPEVQAIIDAGLWIEQEYGRIIRTVKFPEDEISEIYFDRMPPLSSVEHKEDGREIYYFIKTFPL